MKRILICVALLASTLSALAGGPLPRDVRKFIDRREGCDHMRGEIPDPAEKHRMKEVNREMAKLCKGTDKALSQLKKKYAANASVMQRLNEFEDDIEAPGESASKNSERHSSRTGLPASTCLRTAMIGLSVKREVFM